MTYCLNPVCQQPQNSDSAESCQNCGAELRLGDRYRPLKPIGQGGFGRTFLAVDELEAAKPFCVVKQLLPRHQSISPEKAAELFRQEVEQLAELGRHPQIPALLAHFELGETQYLVQEFVDGQNLEAILQEQGTFGETQIRALLADLLPVLDFIHRHRVIHRDVKPENIIRPYTSYTSRFPSERQRDRLVLVDFGAAKAVTGTVLARTGTVIGSAGYVAPEQAMGKAEFASDLYSLGVTCIHLLTGTHPFDLYSVSEDAWVWRQYLPRPISSSLRRILDKLLQKATSQRYRSAAAVLQDLHPEPSRVNGRTAAQATRTRNSRKVSASSDRSLEPDQQWYCAQTLTGHEGEVSAIAISPVGRILASGSSDKTIKLWSLATGELLHSFSGRSLWFGSGHSDRVTALSFSPNGKFLISGSNDGTIKLWDLTTRQLLDTLPGHGWGISALGLSPDGYLLASGSSDGLIQLWDLETQELLADLNKHQGQISTLLIDPGGHTLISGSYDKTICLWDLADDRLLNTLKGHVDRVSAIAMSPDGYTLISGGYDKTLKFWLTDTGEQLRVVAAHRAPILCIAMHPDSKLLASGSEDSTIKLWDLKTGDRLSTLQHTWGVNAIAFSPDGELLISGSADETIKIWQRD